MDDPNIHNTILNGCTAHFENINWDQNAAIMDQCVHQYTGHMKYAISFID